MLNTEKQSGENERQYLWRIGRMIDSGKISNWKEITPTINAIWRENLDEYRDSASYRKAYQCARNFYEDVFVFMQDGTSEQQMKTQLDDLRIAKQQFFDQRREYRAYLSEESRFAHLVQILHDNITALPHPQKMECASYGFTGAPVSAVCQLSDWHCGIKIRNQFNTYDVSEMRRRANVILQKTILYCTLNNVQDLVIEVNGDMICGIIQLSNRCESEEDAIQQILTVSDVLSVFIHALQSKVRHVRVVTTLGNHGRLMAKKSDCNTRENFEMLIPEFLKLRLPDIEIVTSDGLDFMQYQVAGKLICVSHGQNDTVSRAIDDFSKMYHRVPDEVHLAHTHSYKDIGDCDIFVTVNGSLVGTDDFALTCRKVTTPAQNLIIYGEDRCVYSLTALE